MKKIIYSILLLLAVTLSSCVKDRHIVINPDVAIEVLDKVVSGSLSLPQDGSVTLSAKIDKATAYTLIWSVNGNQVSIEKEFKFVATELGWSSVELAVLNQDGGRASAKIKVNVHGRYKQGAFILNEGNMTTENGSLIFITPEGAVADSVFFKANGSDLGNSAQDLYIGDNKMYIISQSDGKALGGAAHNNGRLIVANAETLKIEVSFSSDIASLSQPSHVAVIGHNAYIRDGKGVHNFNLASKTLTYIDGTAGAAKNRMAVVADKVFVPAGKRIFVLKDGALIHTIDMPGAVSGIIKSYDKHLWVSCTTAPAQISKIKSSDYTTIQTNELPLEAKVGAGYGVSPGISAKADSIYFSNATTKIYRHIFTQNRTELMTDVKDHIANAGVVYNNLAVHPLTGEVYFNTIKGYGQDYLINNISIFSFSGATPILKADHKDYTRFPAGVFFTDNY